MSGDVFCAKQDCGHTSRALAGKGGVRTKIESTMMTILEVSEMSSHPSTVSVVGRAVRRVAKRRYYLSLKLAYHTILQSKKRARTPIKSDLLVSPNLGSYPIMPPSAT